MYLAPTNRIQPDGTGYFPINTKWGGTSTLGTLSGLTPGGGLRYFRPNYAMNRGLYPGALGQMDPSKWYLGQLTVEPGTLALGVGALALGMFLVGRKHPKRARRHGRLRRALRELRA